MIHPRPILLALSLLALSGPPTALAQSPPETSSITSVLSADFPAVGGGAQLIDVREAAEWSETGVAEGAATISVSRPDFVEAVIAQVGGDRSRPVALICRSGGRSSKAAERLAAAGFTRIVNVSDGMLGRGPEARGWIAAGRPVKPWTGSGDGTAAGQAHR